MKTSVFTWIARTDGKALPIERCVMSDGRVVGVLTNVSPGRVPELDFGLNFGDVDVGVEPKCIEIDDRECGWTTPTLVFDAAGQRVTSAVGPLGEMPERALSRDRRVLVRMRSSGGDREVVVPAIDRRGSAI